MIDCRETSNVKGISKRPSLVKREVHLVGDRSVWLMACSWEQKRPLSIPDHTLLAMRHKLFSADEIRTTSDSPRISAQEPAA